MGNEQDLKVAYGIAYKPSQVRSLKKDGDKLKIDLNNGVTIWTSPQKKENKAVIEANNPSYDDNYATKTSLKNFKTGNLRVFGTIYSDKLNIDNSNISRVTLDSHSNGRPVDSANKKELEGDELTVTNSKGDGAYLYNGVLVAEKINISNSKDFDVAPVGVPHEGQLFPSLAIPFGNSIVNFNYDLFTKGTELNQQNCKDINQIGPDFDKKQIK